MDSWDLIHMRMLSGSVSSWPELYANVIRYVLSPLAISVAGRIEDRG